MRYVQLALTVDAEDWGSWRQKRRIEQCLRTTRDELTALRQLYVEVVLLKGQPANPRAFWKWIKGAIGAFRGLDAFVLKISIKRWRPWGPPRFTSGDEPLSSWDEDEYTLLKEVITSGSHRPAVTPLASALMRHVGLARRS